MALNDRVATLFFAPGGVGPLAGANCRGEAGSAAAGARVVIEARIRDGVVEDAAFRAYGCPHLIAACEMAVRALRGQPAGRLMALDPLGFAAELGLPEGKRGRLLTLQDALRNCFGDWDTTRPAG